MTAPSCLTLGRRACSLLASTAVELKDSMQQMRTEVSLQVHHSSRYGLFAEGDSHPPPAAYRGPGAAGPVRGGAGASRHPRDSLHEGVCAAAAHLHALAGWRSSLGARPTTLVESHLLCSWQTLFNNSTPPFTPSFQARYDCILMTPACAGARHGGSTVELRSVCKDAVTALEGANRGREPLHRYASLPLFTTAQAG